MKQLLNQIRKKLDTHAHFKNKGIIIRNFYGGFFSRVETALRSHLPIK